MYTVRRVGVKNVIPLWRCDEDFEGEDIKVIFL